MNDQTTPELLRKWLKSLPEKFPSPLQRKRYRKTSGQLVLGVEVYLMRYARIPYVEFCIYWPELAFSCFEDKGAQIFVRRLFGPPRPRDGFRGDMSIADFHERRDFYAGEIVRQGMELFGKTYTPELLYHFACDDTPGQSPDGDFTVDQDRLTLRDTIERSGLLD